MEGGWKKESERAGGMWDDDSLCFFGKWHNLWHRHWQKRRGVAPKVLFDNGFGVEAPCLSCSGESMERGDKRGACWRWYVRMPFQNRGDHPQKSSQQGLSRGIGGDPSCRAWIALRTRGPRMTMIWCVGQGWGQEHGWLRVRDNGGISVVISGVNKVFVGP